MIECGILTMINWSVFKRKIEKKKNWSPKEVLDLIDECEQNEDEDDENGS